MASRLLRASRGAHSLLRQLQGGPAQPFASPSKAVSSWALRPCASSGTTRAHLTESPPSPLTPLSSPIHTPPSLTTPQRVPSLLSASPLLRQVSTTPPPGSTAEADGASAPDSDDDFKPQYRKPEEALPIHQLIEEDVKGNPVMVYMKGVPTAPMCGFSNGVVQILRAYGVDFKSRNVLEDDELRQGIKTYSQWPTIPQVYVNGEFVGGCDILFKMHEAGELESLFASVKGKAQ